MAGLWIHGSVALEKVKTQGKQKNAGPWRPEIKTLRKKIRSIFMNIKTTQKLLGAGPPIYVGKGLQGLSPRMAALASTQ